MDYFQILVVIQLTCFKVAQNGRNGKLSNFFEEIFNSKLFAFMKKLENRIVMHNKSKIHPQGISASRFYKIQQYFITDFRVKVTAVEASSHTSNGIPENIIDNDYSTIYHSLPTDESPWVKVHFTTTTVVKVEVANRLKCRKELRVCVGRLEGAEILLIGKNITVRSCGKITDVNLISSLVEDQTYTTFCGNEVGDTVKVQGRGDTALNFNEIRLYTDPREGKKKNRKHFSAITTLSIPVLMNTHGCICVLRMIIQ